jgi:hypothetical protein
MYTGENSTRMDLKYNKHSDEEVHSFDSGHSIVTGFVNSVIKLHIPQQERNFLTTQVLATYSRSALPHYKLGYQLYQRPCT